MTCHIYIFQIEFELYFKFGTCDFTGISANSGLLQSIHKSDEFLCLPYGSFLGPKPSIFPPMAPSNCHDVMLPSFQIIKPYSPEINMTMEKQPFEDVPTIEKW